MSVCKNVAVETLWIFL